MNKGPERYIQLTNTKTGEKKMVKYGDPKWFDNKKPLVKAEKPEKKRPSDRRGSSTGYMVTKKGSDEERERVKEEVANRFKGEKPRSAMSKQEFESKNPHRTDSFRKYRTL